ncbi:hypothetical protein [Roseivivax sp. CAU 1761]
METVLQPCPIPLDRIAALARALPGCRLEHRAVLTCDDPARGLARAATLIAAAGLEIVACACDASGRITATLGDADGGGAERFARGLAGSGLAVAEWRTDAVFRP